MSWTDDIHKQTGGNDFNQDVSDWLSLGYLPLNKSLSGSFANGLPVGRIIELCGGSSSGKTLLATMAMIETQRKGGMAVMLDHEYAFSLSRAQQLGLSIDKKHWLYKQPMTAEEGFGLVQMICEAVDKKNRKEHVTIVIDSVASMVPKEKMAAGIDGQNMRTRLSLASVLSGALPQIAGYISRHNVTLLLVNQIRMKPGVVFGDNETTPGGQAIEFYPSVRIKLSKGGKIKDRDDSTQVIGETVRSLTIKNKVSMPFQRAEYISNFAEGIDLETSHINAAVEAKLLEKSGAYVVWNSKKSYVSVLAQQMKKDRKEYEKLLKLFLDSEN